MKHLLFLVIIASLSSAWAKSPTQSHYRTQRRPQNAQVAVASSVSLRTWAQNEETVVRKSGNEGLPASRCQKFQVQLHKDIDLKIQCDAFSSTKTITLQNSDKQTVSRHGDSITITRFSFQTRKVQIEQLKQATLRIPYVEEIIHINIRENGELVYHQENYSVDQFGRIVQSYEIQARGLVPVETQLTAGR